ncbi:MAG: Uncharacterised protein [Prochlorococcus marinus str. MIT 9313]|nr:MAG: Uncharacterised protein [Prochlorococcus marinus str. MIT 9313]
MGTWQETNWGQEHQQSTQRVGGHHHATFRPAISPDTRHGSQQHCWNGVGYINACGKQGDLLGAGFEIHPDRRRHLCKRLIALRGTAHPVLGNQVHHQNDVELVGQLGEDLTDPQPAKAIQLDHRCQSAASFWIRAGWEGRFGAV